MMNFNFFAVDYFTYDPKMWDFEIDFIRFNNRSFFNLYIDRTINGIKHLKINIMFFEFIIIGKK